MRRAADEDAVAARSDDGRVATDGRPHLDLETETFVRQGRARLTEGLADRDRLTSLVLGFGFLAAALALVLWLDTARDPSPFVYVLFVLAYAVASRVEYEISHFPAVPTVLVLVPMLFTLPLSAVPLCVAAGMLLSEPRDLVGAGVRERLLLRLVDSWHAVGPVLVLATLAPPERGPDWSHWPIYLAALAAQFAFDFAASAIRACFALGIPLRAHARSMLSVSLGDVALAPVGLMLAFTAYDRPYLLLLVGPLLGLLAALTRERRARLDSALELSDAYRGTALLLGDVIEADDEYTGSHSRDVVSLVVDVAIELGLGPDEARQAELTALLHDVGKIRIPPAIINKPGPLSEEEREVMKSHTILGEAMLEQVGGQLGLVGHLVRSCHERWDGGGYPDGLSGDRIPLVSRIVCCCDAYSAMTTDRPYRAALTVDAAIRELQQSAGTQFDPAVADAVARVVRRGRRS